MADADYDGTVGGTVSQWIPNCEQYVVEAEQALEHARKRLEEVKADVKKYELEASTDKSNWEELRKAL